MSLFDDTHAVERPAFFDGQELFAADLDGIVGLNRAMRWLHNRSLHQAGVGNGYAVAGRRGDREVRVQPGYALDALGREIVLLDTAELPVPPVAADRDGLAVVFDVTVSYPPDDDLDEVETRAGICRPRGVVRRRERPVFCWVRLERAPDGTLRAVDPAQAADIDAGMKVVLTRAAVRNCKLDADLSIVQRRNARPPDQPHIACGRATVDWQPWKTTNVKTPTPLGIQADVDTSAAGFRLVPSYSARVAYPRPVAIPSNNGGGTVYAFDLPAFVEGPAADGFHCRVAFLPVGGAELDGGRLTELVDIAAAWPLVWMGVEG
jgi:hypothetical protein